jgi:hypothetical protein
VYGVIADADITNTGHVDIRRAINAAPNDGADPERLKGMAQLQTNGVRTGEPQMGGVPVTATGRRPRGQ